MNELETIAFVILASLVVALVVMYWMVKLREAVSK